MAQEDFDPNSNNLHDDNSIKHDIDREASVFGSEFEQEDDPEAAEDQEPCSDEQTFG
ncbi:hypothetical protein B0H13DRAFT_2344507 [Mycena leptocephala]|nr:hypothetical protein B0H13DRAFT_2344507 [Mycena leptocephala]